MLFPLFSLFFLSSRAQDFSPPQPSAGLVASDGVVPNPQWSTLLGNLLWFYDAQRSGKLSSDNRVSWRNDSTLDDGQLEGLDLTGGFFDAGNYIKATYPLSWTLTSIAWSAVDFGRGFTLSNQDKYLDSTLRWGYDWLIKCHPSADILYVQTGKDDDDNFYWGGDQNIPHPRPSFQINSSYPGTDVAASTAAAFASGSYLYNGGRSLIDDAYSSNLLDSDYANTLLSHAKDLYSFAQDSRQIVYSDSVQAVQNTYPSSGFQDDLILASMWLYLATNDTGYLDDIKQSFNSKDILNQKVVMNWDSKYPAVYVLGAEMEKRGTDIGGNGVSQGEQWCDAVQSGGGAIVFTDGGLIWWDGDSQAASLNPALNAAQLCVRMSHLTSDSQKSSIYLDIANRQTNYALGQNDMNVPYVVGQHPNSPVNPHSALAAGGDDVNHIDDVPEQEAYVLFGGVVGGPDQKDRYFDIRSDYPETEIALDYQAPLVALSAYYIINNGSDPFYVSLAEGTKVTPKGHPVDEAFPATSGKGISTGAKIAIAVVVILAVLGALIAFAWWKKGQLRAWNRRRRLNRY